MMTSKIIVTIAAMLIALPASGQQNSPAPPGKRTRIDDAGAAVSSDDSNVAPVPKSERQRSKDLPQISVIDKLLSIESALGGKLNRSTETQWVKDYNELYQRFREDGTPSSIRGGGRNIAYTALALGIKASDGVLALKARNLEALKNAADQIEVLARKLGATEGELGMANTVKIYANKNQWFNAFLALGRLQRDVLGYLKSNPEKTDQAVLVIVGGWLQGGRCVTHVIDKHYDDYVSNILREQRLVELIRENMEKLAPVYLNDPLLAEIIKDLPEIRNRVNVGLKAPVKQEDVKWLHHTFDDLVTRIMTLEEPVVAPTASPAPDTPAGSAPEAQPRPPTAVHGAEPAPSLPLPAGPAPSAAKPTPPPVAANATAGNPSVVRQPAGRNGWPVIAVVLLLAATVVILIRRQASRRT